MVRPAGSSRPRPSRRETFEAALKSCGTFFWLKSAEVYGSFDVLVSNLSSSREA